MVTASSKNGVVVLSPSRRKAAEARAAAVASSGSSLAKIRGRSMKPPAKLADIPALNIEVFNVKLVGDSELITNQWSEKAIRMIEGKGQRTATGPREPRNPQEECEAAIYRDADGNPAMPTIAFKSAAVDACSQVSDITKVQARGAFHLVGELVRIDGKWTRRRDMVRVGMGNADVRYRPGFKEWSVILTIRHNPNVLSASQIINLLNIAGFAVGVGEGRPERNMAFGMFHVEPIK